MNKPPTGTTVRSQGREPLSGLIIEHPEDRPDWNSEDFVTVEWEDGRVTDELVSDVTPAREVTV